MILGLGCVLPVVTHVQLVDRPQQIVLHAQHPVFELFLDPPVHVTQATTTIWRLYACCVILGALPACLEQPQDA